MAQCSCGCKTDQELNAIVKKMGDRILAILNPKIDDIRTRLTKLETESSTAQKIADAIQMSRFPVTASATNKDFPIPEFNPKSTTPDEFINEVERYYKLQRYQPKDFKDIFKGLLPGDMKSWYEFTSKPLNTWDEVKLAFIKRYDTFEERIKREKYLIELVQSDEESTEKFLYDTWKSAKLCYPNERDESIVQRVQSTIHWRIKKAIGGPVYKSFDELLRAVQEVYPALENEDDVLKNQRRIPPFSRLEAGLETHVRRLQGEQDGSKIKQQQFEDKSKTEDYITRTRNAKQERNESKAERSSFSETHNSGKVERSEVLENQTENDQGKQRCMTFGGKGH